MAFSVTNVGAQNFATTGHVVTYTGGNVSGVVIFLCSYESGSTIGGSVADTHGDTFTSIQSAFNNNSSANGFGNTFYAANATLNTNDTITYTPIGNTGVFSVCYITGAVAVSPLDTGVTAKATGTGTTPSVTGGTASVAGNLNVGVVANKNGTSAPGFVQASGWSTPPNQAPSSVGTASGTVSGGNELNAGTTGLTYNPTLGSFAWSCFICAFKAAVADVLFAQASL